MEYIDTVMVDLGNENYNLKREIEGLREQLRKSLTDKDKCIASNLSLAKGYQINLSVVQNTLVHCQLELSSLNEKYESQGRRFRDATIQIDVIKEKLKATEHENFLLKHSSVKKNIKFDKIPVKGKVRKSVSNDSSVLKFIKF